MASKQKHMPGDVRRDSILSAAVQLSRRAGYNNVTRQGIAAAAECSEALVSRYFGTMPALRRQIMRAAIRDSVHEIVAQGLACQDKHAQKAPPGLKQQAIEYLTRA